MEPSGLSEEQQNQMTSIFDNSFWTDGTHLEFDGEFYAVMAHEVGHISGNHSMQNVVRVTGVSMVLGWMFGDLSFVTNSELHETVPPE